MLISKRISDKNGEFYIDKNGEKIAEMTFTFAGKNILTVEHTWVSPKEEGLGLGKKMFDELINFAREHSIKIFATCPYVIHNLDKYKDELIDVIGE